MHNVQATEYEVKFQKRGSDNPVQRARFFAPDAEKTFEAWLEMIVESDDPKNYIYLGERECTGEPITLEVKDVIVEPRGKIG